MNLSAILWSSVALQLVAAVYALRLIPLSGRMLAWSILSFAFFLMALRRAISLLYQQGYIHNEVFQDFTAESIALLISVLTISGVLLIKRIFVDNERNTRDLNNLSQVIKQSPISTFITNQQGKILYANQSFLNFKGISLENCLGKNIVTIQALGENRAAYEEVFLAINGKTDWQGEFSVKDKNNIGHCLSTRISAVENDNDNNIVFTMEDITAAKKQQNALKRQALYDGLTDLPNRTLFIDRLEQAILSAQRKNTSLAVILMDLDHFKEINDTLGHQYGDLLLKELGPIIHSKLRSIDTVARMGGDEFLILLPGSNEEHGMEVAEILLAAISEPFLVDGHTLEVGASMGIAIYPTHADDPNSLIRRADVAMYEAKRKRSGRNIYNPKNDQHNPVRLTMMTELRQAIDQDQLSLYYQPKMSLKTDQCVGVEALIRWDHLDRGLILPNMFIESAEKSGTIKPLTQWVLRTALAQFSQWYNQGFHIDLSVNISARDFQDPDLLTLIEKLLSDSGFEPSRLILELTESAVMTDSQKAFDALSRLDKMGVKLAIDDFGTGHSSLNYLKRLPVDELKIDKSFVRDMSTSKYDAAIVRSTIDLAHNLELHVVAEGVEDQSSLDLLKDMGCDTVQGFFKSRPLAEKIIPDFLSINTKKTV